MSDIVELSNYINGEWRQAVCEHWIEDYSPANGSLIARIPCSSSEDVDAAVSAAQDAAEGWRGRSSSAAERRCLRVRDGVQLQYPRVSSGGFSERQPGGSGSQAPITQAALGK